MKEVTIYSSASCDWNTREGRLFAALQYQGHYKYVSGVQTETTADRCILTGFLEAVHPINEPCKLTLVTATRISFNHVGNPKGRNKELKQLLLNIINENWCQFDFDEWTGGGDRLKARLSEIERGTTKVEPANVIAKYGAGTAQSQELF